jgi:hypothetical protein
MRPFADANGKVSVMTRVDGRVVTRAPKSVLFEPDFYSVHGEDGEELDHGLVEGLYSAIENVAAPIFERLRREDFPLDGPSRAEFAVFMATLVTRGHQFISVEPIR